MKFHKAGLDEMIARLNIILKPKLNIIDGIYSIERGPSTSGRAYRSNLIIASRDAFSGDIVGTTCLGIDPQTLFLRYARFCIMTNLKKPGLVKEIISQYLKMIRH